VAKKLYVGNLSYGTSDSSLQQLFEQYGTVLSAQVIMDRESGRSKGFGFVEMQSDSEAQAAIDGLNQHEVDGRPLTVNEARPREDRGGGGARTDAPAPAVGHGGDQRYVEQAGAEYVDLEVIGERDQQGDGGDTEQASDQADRARPNQPVALAGRQVVPVWLAGRRCVHGDFLR